MNDNLKKIKTKDLYPKVGEIKKYVNEPIEKLPDSLELNILTDKDKEKIHNLLLETVWISRWTDEKKNSLYAVLTTEEAKQMVKDILNDLDNKGFKIVKK